MDIQHQLMATNLKRIDRLTRRGLLVFLDLETSKQNTNRLRIKARLVAINASDGDVDLDLTNAENLQKVDKHGFLVRSLPIILAAALVAGCTTIQASWQKAGQTTAQTTTDAKQCEYEAEQGGLGTGSRRNPLGSGFDEMLNKMKLQSLCMEARGYAKIWE